ncbi:hypothetical protein [Limnochorda pilosa]|uniref:Uncharacterized protein n=1 Tax=Limnochorda pilosa TaxID=1555112 RepID=A0A0K2SKV1_LIMPI|nr:hypothetical protein [Limnochorda pilosa]BAS27736.1 hypothetical protein LIP_1895 [Limnochorda pilosa]
MRCGDLPGSLKRGGGSCHASRPRARARGKGRPLPWQHLIGIAAALLVGGALAGAAPAEAGSTDLVEALLKELPQRPPEFSQVTLDAAGKGKQGSLTLSKTAIFSLAEPEALVKQGLVPASLQERSAPFWVLGPHLERTAVYPAPPDRDDVQFLLPLLAARPWYTSKDEILSYSVLGDLEGPGRESIPASAVVIYTWDGAQVREWNWQTGAVVLPKGVQVAVFWIGVKATAWGDGNAWRKAGTYRGVLAAATQGKLPDVDFAVRLDPHLALQASDELTFHAAAPNTYQAEAQLEVTYQANFAGWALDVEVIPPKALAGDEPSIPPERLRYRMGPTCGEDDAWKPVPTGSFTLLTGPSALSAETRVVCFQVATTWADAAGKYEGSVRLTVRPE